MLTELFTLDNGDTAFRSTIIAHVVKMKLINTRSSITISIHIPKLVKNAKHYDASQHGGLPMQEKN